MATNWTELRTGLLDLTIDTFVRNDSGNVPVLMMLGGFKFSIATAVYSELSRHTQFRWPKMERYGRLATRQYTGPDEDSVTLPGVLFPDWRGGHGQLDDLRVLAAKGEPLQWIDSFGRVLGWWVIEGIEEKQALHKQDGTPRKVEFTLSITRVPDDQMVPA
ncbi:phage tail protein [Dyella sp. M7H15-1]|uniref:phage tail protein n=1 Tax=Dyella sp. M7H15-1 TaxID=2501295 RepID=UPI001004EDFF|nr:phage tail protein [Dyella sp. M7H15-1]QAU22896.1 phage tail protein [Dyella sp. M7H15-1]